MLTGTQILEDYADCIENVKQYIRDPIHEPLNRETLADVAGFSVPHFHRVFIAHVGESAGSYVRRLRLERAARMGAVDITEVTLAAGYDSHAVFSRAFKQQFGLSPRGFRQPGCWAATQLLRKG